MVALGSGPSTEVHKTTNVCSTFLHRLSESEPDPIPLRAGVKNHTMGKPSLKQLLLPNPENQNKECVCLCACVCFGLPKVKNSCKV